MPLKNPEIFGSCLDFSSLYSILLVSKIFWEILTSIFLSVLKSSKEFEKIIFSAIKSSIDVDNSISSSILIPRTNFKRLSWLSFVFFAWSNESSAWANVIFICSTFSISSNPFLYSSVASNRSFLKFSRLFSKSKIPSLRVTTKL